MKRLLFYILLLTTLGACSYDETVETCRLSIQLVYPESYDLAPQAGIPVELKDAKASVFMAETDDKGTAHFYVPPGIYEASSNSNFYVDIDDQWRWNYILNGVKSLIIVSPDSLNQTQMELKGSRIRRPKL